MSYLSTFADNLAAIDGSVDSITALSTYMRLHSGEADELVDTWHTVLETTDVGSLLYMLYLANDVVQNKRAGGADVYMGEFKRIMPDALDIVLRRSPAARDRVSKLVGIWADRRVFPDATLAACRAKLVHSSGFVASPPRSLPRAIPEPQLFRRTSSFGRDAAAVTKSLGEVLPEFHKAFATNSYIDRQLGLLPADVASGSVDLSAVPARDRYRVRQQLNVAKTRLTEKKLTVEELDLQRSALIAAIRAALSVEERALEKVSTMREGLERLRTDYSQLKAKEASGLKLVMKPEASAVALEAVSLPSPTAAGVVSEYSQDDLRDLLEPEEPQSKKSRTYTEASEVTARLAQPDVMVWNPVIMQYVSAARLGSETSAEDWRD